MKVEIGGDYDASVKRPWLRFLREALVGGGQAGVPKLSGAIAPTTTVSSPENGSLVSIVKRILTSPSSVRSPSFKGEPVTRLSFTSTPFIESRSNIENVPSCLR